MVYVVDAHAFVWYLENNPKLSDGAARAMDGNATLLIPSIALAEALDMIKRGRSAFLVEDLWRYLDEDQNVEIVPLDLMTIKRSQSIEMRDIHDRLIVATAILVSERATDFLGLITFDRAITESKAVRTV